MSLLEIYEFIRNRILKSYFFAAAYLIEFDSQLSRYFGKNHSQFTFVFTPMKK